MGDAKTSEDPAHYSRNPQTPADAAPGIPHTIHRLVGDLQKTRKRPSSIELGFQALVAYALRFIMEGDLCGTRATLGGVEAQMAHLGTGMSLAVAENATLSHVYESKIRTYAQELPKFRKRE